MAISMTFSDFRLLTGSLHRYNQDGILHRLPDLRVTAAAAALDWHVLHLDHEDLRRPLPCLPPRSQEIQMLRRNAYSRYLCGAGASTYRCPSHRIPSFSGYIHKQPYAATVPPRTPLQRFTFLTVIAHLRCVPFAPGSISAG